MSLLDGNKSVLRFNLLMESVNLVPGEGSFPWRIPSKINSTPWMDKEPESCMVVEFKQKEPVPIGKTAMMDHAEFKILVGYRPHGWISDEKHGGRERLNGWHLEIIARTNDGTLLDGAGKPLPPGQEPVFLCYNVYELADFNDYDFGNFLGEE